MAYSYREVKDIYDELQSAGAVTSSLPEWSAEMGRLSKSDLYSQGLTDNFVKRTSVGIDKLLELTGIPDATENLGRLFGSTFNDAETGAEIGRSLPRMAVNFLPMLTPGGRAAQIAGRVGTGLLSGAEAYTATDSPLAGLFAAGTNMLMPNVANRAEQFVLSRMGGRKVAGQLADEVGNLSNVSRFFPQTIDQGVASQAAGQVAAAGFGEASSAVQSYVDGNPETNYLEDFSPTAFALNMTLGQLPFAGVYLTKSGKVGLGGRTSKEHADALEGAMARTEQLLALTKAKEEVRQQTPLEKDPVRNEAVETETTEILNKITKPATRDVQFNLSKVGTESTTTVDPFEHTTMFKETQELLKSAVSLDDLNSVVTAVNDIRVKKGFTPVSEKEIAQHQARFNVDGKSAVQAVKTKTERAIEAAEQARQTRAAELQEEANFVADLRLQAQQGGEVATNILALRNDFSQRSGRYSQAVDTGLFDRTVREWIAEGKSTDIESLKAKFDPIIKAGKGIKKDPLSRPLEVAMDQTPESAPIANEVLVQAIKLTEGTKYSDDRKRFLWLVQEGGLGDPTKAADILLEQEGLTAQEAREEVDALFDAPYFVEWTNQLNEATRPTAKAPEPPINVDEIARISNDPNLSPEQKAEQVTALTKPTARAPEVPFVPTNEKDLALIQQIGQDGHSALAFLEGSENAFFRTLAQNLKPYQNLLSRINVKFLDNDGNSYARGTVDGSNLVDLNLSSAILSGDSTYRDFIVMHELIHGLTMQQVHDPFNANFLIELSQFRVDLANQLPRALRAAHLRAVQSDWITKWQKGEVSFESIAPDATAAEREVLYALLNNDEFLAQGFSSPHMKKFLTGATVKGQTGLHKFANWVKSLLGLGDSVQGTAFEQFLSHATKVLDAGERTVDVNTYAKRWFENRGLVGDAAKAQSRRVVGLLNSLPVDTTMADVLQTIIDPNEKPIELVKAQTALNEMLQTKPDDVAALGQIMPELGGVADESGLAALTFDMVTGEMPDIPAILDLLPQDAANYIFATVKDMKDVVDAAAGATSQRNEGVVNVFGANLMRKGITDAQRSLNAILEYQQHAEQSSRFILDLNAIAPDGFLDKVAAAPGRMHPDVADFVEGTKNGGKAFGNWVKWLLNTPAQIARTNPEVAEFVARGYELQSNARQFSKNALQVLGFDFGAGKVTSEAVKKSSKAIGNPRTEAAINKWMYWNNEIAKREKRGVTLLSDSHPEIAKLKKGLTDEQWKGVVDTVSQGAAMTQMVHRQALQHMQKIGSTRAATIVMKDKNLKLAQALPLADGLFNALSADFTNPQQATIAGQQIAAVQQQMTPEGFNSLLKYTQAEVEKLKVAEERFKENTAWASAQRQEKYLVTFNRGGKVVETQASSMKEARIKAQGASNVSIKPNHKGDPDAFPVLGPDNPALFKRMEELEQNQRNVMAQYLTPEGLAAFDKMSVVTQFERETAASSGIPGTQAPARLLSKGADELPWLWNHISWVQRQGNYWSRQLFRAQADALLLEPELMANEDLSKLMTTHRDNMLQADPDVPQKIQRFITSWFMGFNPASAMVNATQSLTTHAAELTAMSGKPVDSYKRIGKAFAELTKHWKTDKWTNPEHEKFMAQMVKDGEVDYSMFDDQAAAQEAAETNHKREMFKNKPLTIGQRLGTMAGSVSNASMFMFRGVEKVNNQLALLAGYDYYRDQGLSEVEATAKAKEFNHSVNFGGGKANRPIGAFSGRSDTMRTAAMMGTSLQSYVLGTTAMIARYLKKGYFQPAGLKPSEKYAAQKAAMQMMGVQLTLAGGLGLPFVSGAIALLNKMFPDWEINKNIREKLAQLFDEDEEQGGVLSDIAMTGLPSMLGWDLQSRLSMGTIPGVSESNGFQPELLLGAPVNLISNFLGGAMKLAKGETQGADAFVPPAIRKLTKLVQNDGTVKDYKNRPLFQPTAAETVGIALGFQPKRQSDLNAASRMLDQSEDITSRRESQFHDQLAEQTLKGNFGTVRQELLARAKTDPNYDPTAAVRAIARAAEAKTLPRDLRNEGTARNAASRNQLLSTYKIDPNSLPSETQRLQFRQQIQARLGVPAVDRQEAVLASLVDRLRLENPTMARSELRRRAQRLLSTSRRVSTLAPESL